MYKIDLSNTKRVVAVADDGYDFSDIFGEDVSFIVVENNRSFGNFFGTDYGLFEPVKELSDRFRSNRVLRERAVSLYLGLLGYSSRVVELRGYSQSDWVTGVLVTREMLESGFESLVRDVATWFRGDVFVLCLEELKTFVNVEDVSDVVTRWDVVDSVGCWLIEDRAAFRRACVDSFAIADVDWVVDFV